MAPTGVEFVRAVMKQLGATNAAELAEKMQWKRGTERLAAKWLAGSHKPSYPYMMEMIDRCGWLSSGAATPARASSRDRLAELEAKIDRQGEATTQTLQDLEAQLSQIRELLTPPAQAATEDPG